MRRKALAQHGEAFRRFGPALLAIGEPRILDGNLGGVGQKCHALGQQRLGIGVPPKFGEGPGTVHIGLGMVREARTHRCPALHRGGPVATDMRQPGVLCQRRTAIGEACDRLPQQPIGLLCLPLLTQCPGGAGIGSLLLHQACAHGVPQARRFRPVPPRLGEPCLLHDDPGFGRKALGRIGQQRVRLRQPTQFTQGDRAAGVAHNSLRVAGAGGFPAACRLRPVTADMCHPGMLETQPDDVRKPFHGVLQQCVGQVEVAGIAMRDGSAGVAVRLVGEAFADCGPPAQRLRPVATCVREPCVIDRRCGIVGEPGYRFGQQRLGFRGTSGLSQGGRSAGKARRGPGKAVLHRLPAVQRFLRGTQALGGAGGFDGEWGMLREAELGGVEQDLGFSEAVGREQGLDRRQERRWISGPARGERRPARQVAAGNADRFGQRAVGGRQVVHQIRFCGLGEGCGHDYLTSGPGRHRLRAASSLLARVSGETAATNVGKPLLDMVYKVRGRLP